MKVSPPLVSIVIPAYNAEKFLERTIRSAQDQTHSPLEILIVNDGSTDRTRQIAEAAAATDPRIRTIHVANGGVARARNLGTREAQGEFIAFLDADDLWHPTKITAQLAIMSDDIAAVYCLSRRIDEDDRILAYGTSRSFEGYVLARHMYARPVGNGSNLLVRRHIVLEVGGYEPNWIEQGLGGCEDVDLELLVAARYRLRAVPQFLVGYRISHGNMSSDPVRMTRATLAIIAHHVRLNPAIPAWAARDAEIFTFEYSLGALIETHHWRFALQVLIALFRRSPARGAASLLTPLRIVWSRLKWTYLPRVRHKLLRQPLVDNRPLFHELSPDFCVGAPQEQWAPYQLRSLDRLAKLDEAMEPSNLLLPDAAIPDGALQGNHPVPLGSAAER